MRKHVQHHADLAIPYQPGSHSRPYWACNVLRSNRHSTRLLVVTEDQTLLNAFHVGCKAA